jgi:hypothetical protein
MTPPPLLGNEHPAQVAPFPTLNAIASFIDNRCGEDIGKIVDGRRSVGDRQAANVAEVIARFAPDAPTEWALASAGPIDDLVSFSRLMAGITAHRRIVEQYRGAWQALARMPHREHGVTAAVKLGLATAIAETAGDAVRALAVLWERHAEYRPTWRPLTVAEQGRRAG